MDIAVESVQRGEDECVFITEHEGLYSAGRSFSSDDFLDDGLRMLDVYYPNRGGMVTVHSLGQVVVYPIINLRNRNMNVGQYVSILEHWMINVLHLLGIESKTSDKGRGVWTDFGKIGFVGIGVTKGVSRHGLCLNVSNDVSLFKHVVPCGMKDLKVTSVELITGERFSISKVSREFINTSPF
jgi:lipoyl(octanoyl) transferase